MHFLAWVISGFGNESIIDESPFTGGSRSLSQGTAPYALFNTKMELLEKLMSACILGYGLGEPDSSKVLREFRRCKRKKVQNY